ncbi:MAG: WbqC family protein [Leptospiraceae bacterium]|nr:WbqC family protein [Leptospiraceae bacterium]
MILTAHQPVYLPWLGLFHKIALADEFCIFDIVQYQTKDWNNRNRIKTPNGVIWLSVPVESKNHFEKSVGDIRIVKNGWNRKHFKSIDLAYRKAPFYTDYIGRVEAILMADEFETLADLNRAFLEFGLEAFGIERPIHVASEKDFEGKKSDLVLDMAQKLGADCYIFGEQGRNYADLAAFQRAGIQVFFQEYEHPEYSQLHGDFVPGMCFLDLLFNVGAGAFEVMMRGNTTRQEILQFSRRGQ